MLTWFPTPYPDETFYSVLCRIYISTGIKEHALVKRQLFGNREGIKMATLYPNAAIHAVLSELPKGLFDERDMILHHTPFLYYTRMYPLEERETLLDELTQGQGKTPTHLCGGRSRRTVTPCGIAPAASGRTHRRLGSRIITWSTRSRFRASASGINAG